MSEDDEDRTIYRVVVNDEEQYSIWPAGRDLPPGWEAEGFEGPKPECLAHIEEVWTDMRPKSLRLAMEGGTEPPAAAGGATGAAGRRPAGSPAAARRRARPRRGTRPAAA